MTVFFASVRFIKEKSGKSLKFVSLYIDEDTASIFEFPPIFADSYKKIPSQPKNISNRQ